MEERALPKNREAEQIVLGAALLEPQEVVPLLLEKLGTEQFYWRAHRIIYQTIRELFDRGEPADFITVANRLEEKNKLTEVGGRIYLSELLSRVTTTTSVEYYADIIKKKAIMRALVEAGREIGELGFKEEEELEEILDEAEELIFKISRFELKQSYHLIGEFLHEHIRNLEKLHRDPDKHTITGISTGFRKFDEMTGGLQPCDLIVIAGRPSIGKSAFATAIARNIALRSKKTVGIFSLEMTKEQLLERLLCGEAMVNLHHLRGGYLKSSSWRKIAEASNKLLNANIIIDDTPAISIMELKAKARRMKAEHDIDLLIVDYLQLVEARSRDVREQEVAYITRSLKELARGLEVPLVAVSQLSRAPERTPRRPRLSDLRECLTGETVIYHAITGEPYTIAELYNSKSLIPVHTVTPDLRLRVTLPAKVVCSGRKLVYRLRTRTGREICASANHPFLTVKGWRKLENLRPGERIAVPRRFSRMGNGSLTVEEARLLGYLVADGSYRKRGAVSLTNSDSLVIKDACQIVQTRFDVPARPKVHWSGTPQVEFSIPGQYGPGRNPLVNWLKRLGIWGETTTIKRIPQAIYQASPKVIAGFIGGLWAGDGSIFYRPRMSIWSLKYTSTSMELLKGLRHLLTRLGIVSILEQRTRHAKSKVDIASLRIDGRIAIRRFARLVPIVGEKGSKLQKAHEWAMNGQTNEQIDRLPLTVTNWVAQSKESQGISWKALGYRCQGKEIGRAHLLKVARILKDPLLKSLAHLDLLWDEIVFIEPKGKELTYDLVVPGTHNFVANDIIVHNSGEIEQTADVVIFLYREDYYEEPEGEDKGPSISETEVIIGKQRNGPLGSFKLSFHKSYASFYDSFPQPQKAPF
jgi:replicative DNA helicase